MSFKISYTIRICLFSETKAAADTLRERERERERESERERERELKLENFLLQGL